MTATNHESRLRNQFSIRVSTFNTAANWMLDEKLIDAHAHAAGSPKPEANRLLDLCCGTGIVGQAFLKRGWHVQGIDITPEMVRETGKLYPAVAGKVEEMPFADDSFDAAVLRQSYMLLNGPAALREIRRVLKPGGLFILGQSVAFSEADDPQYRLIQEARHINWTRYYRTEDLAAELAENGFKIAGKNFLRVRESSTRWMERAPELSPELRTRILDLIQHAPESYRKIRNVSVENGEIFEDWNWLILSARSTK